MAIYEHKTNDPSQGATPGEWVVKVTPAAHKPTPEILNISMSKAEDRTGGRGLPANSSNPAFVGGEHSPLTAPRITPVDVGHKNGNLALCVRRLILTRLS